MVAMRVFYDKVFHFFEIFNEKNGMLIRSNIINRNGKENNADAILRSFPELIDIGIMGKCHVNQMYCKQFGVDCYQANNNASDMQYSDYKKIIDQCKDKTFQVALGGRGDPNKHKDFKKIVKYTHDNGIIPNLTTTGINMTKSEIAIMKKYCGAVAISLYSKVTFFNEKYDETNPLSIAAIERLVSSGIVTNIHYVISNETIDDIIIRLENNYIPKGINALIFLLYKPVGIAIQSKVIKISDKKYKYFMSLLNTKSFNFKIGFDTCFSPLIINNLNKMSKKTIDFCEATRFSCYISPNMLMYPCSFIQKDEYAIDLENISIRNGWLSTKFRNFRNDNEFDFIGSCPNGLNCLSCDNDCKKK